MKKAFNKFAPYVIPIAILLGTLVVLAPLVSHHSLFHDEAVYLSKARAWIEGTPSDEFKLYRPVGMAALGWVALKFGNSEPAVRVFGVIFGAVVGLLIYFAFKKIFNREIAVGTAAIILSSSLFLKQAPLFLNDILSSGLLIAILWLVYLNYESAGKNKLIYLAAPLAAFAFYIRYGVAITLMVAAVISALILVFSFVKKPKRSFVALRNTGFFAAGLLAPHFIYSFVTTKSLFGILQLAGKAAGRKYFGEGLITYIKWLPSELGGWLLGIAAILGVATTLLLVFKKDWRQRYLTLIWIGCVGIVSFAATGFLVHAEARYVFFPVVLLAAVGVAGAYHLARSRSLALANSLIVVLVAVSAFAGFANYQETKFAFKRREGERYHLAYVEASRAIRNDSIGKGGGCGVWSILFRPAISWYSECHTPELVTMSGFEKEFINNPGLAEYSLVFTKLKDRQVSPNESERFGVELSEIFRAKGLDYGDLVAYRVKKTTWLKK